MKCGRNILKLGPDTGFAGASLKKLRETLQDLLEGLGSVPGFMPNTPTGAGNTAQFSTLQVAFFAGSSGTEISCVAFQN